MCELTSFIKEFSPVITMFGTLTAFGFAIDGMLYRKKAEKESQAKMISGWLMFDEYLKEKSQELHEKNKKIKSCVLKAIIPEISK